PEKEEVFQKEKKNFSGEDIQKIVERSDLSLKEKARSVYSESLEIVENIFENPSVDVLAKGKKEIYAIVDFILANEETPVHLLDILSHDFYTYTHSVNVGVLAVALSKRLYKGSNAHDLQELGAGYFLHDLGKVRVDPGIINKPGPLDEREMKTMKTHPYQGYKLLREAEQLSFETKVIVMQHHEREDGTGYPKGLRGEEIHDYGRVGCIADVFDALTAERSYKRSLTPFQALKIMKEEMIGHFHREIFEKFVRLFAASR
ncbi:MAG: HD-GYP domain-containing protein, partial [Nitrospinota bacterium]